MIHLDFQPLISKTAQLTAVSSVGRVCGTEAGGVQVSGISRECGLGDRVVVHLKSGIKTKGEVLRLAGSQVTILIAGSNLGIGIGDRVDLLKSPKFRPDASWVGRIIDPDGFALDGQSLRDGPVHYPLLASPPLAASRRGLGRRLETGMKLFNTMLPLVRGQRLGLFAGSGIGKSTLIGQFAKNLETDISVIALVGERGREVREFVHDTLGPTGMAKSVVVAATSDQSPLEKRRAAWAAMAVAEYFRDQGKQVLLVVDSITRFAEAHREIALAAGEPATMRGFPPSIVQTIMTLCERAGPGVETMGDITAIFSVLVAGSDMEEPIADIIRGVLDGHIVLERKIAERGRFPAVDVLRSVSRSLPQAASVGENTAIGKVRELLGVYEASELMIQSGLYSKGTDQEIDQAMGVWPKLDRYFSKQENKTAKESFSDLKACYEEKPLESASTEIVDTA